MLYSLQSLRGIFAILIFLNHIASFDAGGDAGVAFFFILSGFVLCNGYESRICGHKISFKSFITKRFGKIYPLHLLCFAAAIILQLRAVDTGLLRIWALNLLLLQSWIPISDIYFSANDVSWFLSDILFCYAIFPLAIRFIRKLKTRGLLMFTIVLLAIYFTVVSILPASYANSIIYVNPLSRVVDFTLGIVLWQVWHGSRTTQACTRAEALSYGTKSAIELCVVALLVGTFLAYPYVCINFATASLWWLPAIAVITVFTIFDTKGGVVSALLHKRPLLWFGSISFSFYMIHHLVIRYGEIIMEHLGLPEHPSIVIPLLLVASTVGAYIVSRFFN